MKTLYIIAGCNGAGKTTASLTMLPEIWNCCEFVNADEIARGLSPYNPESMAIEAAGIENFFKIYKDIVDSWMLVENYSVPRIIIASGGKKVGCKINNVELFNKLQEYVR